MFSLNLKSASRVSSNFKRNIRIVHLRNVSPTNLHFNFYSTPKSISYNFLKNEPKLKSSNFFPLFICSCPSFTFFRYFSTSSQPPSSSSSSSPSSSSSSSPSSETEKQLNEVNSETIYPLKDLQTEEPSTAAQATSQNVVSNAASQSETDGAQTIIQPETQAQKIIQMREEYARMDANYGVSQEG